MIISDFGFVISDFKSDFRNPQSAICFQKQFELFQQGISFW
jgi:hypothetical protein